MSSYGLKLLRVILLSALTIFPAVSALSYFIAGIVTDPSSLADDERLALVSAFVGGVAASVAPIWFDRRNTKQRLGQAAEDPGEALRHRIEQVNAAFAEAATLMGDLQRDLEAQQAAREKLLAEAERQQQLLEINQEQAEKIQQILVGETKATIRAERRQQWLFFLLGTMVSVPIGVAINLLVP